jgi:hypothetical protein
MTFNNNERPTELLRIDEILNTQEIDSYKGRSKRQNWEFLYVSFYVVRLRIIIYFDFNHNMHNCVYFNSSVEFFSSF